MNKPVKSAERVLDILEHFAGTGRPLSLREVAAALGLPKSSALMLLRTLEGRGYLARDGERYRLNVSWPVHGGPEPWLGDDAMRLVKLAEPVMRDLVDRLHETVVLGVPTPESDVRVVASLLSPLEIRYDPIRSGVAPSYCTALGQAMLAFDASARVESYIDRCDFAPMTDRTIRDATTFRARLAEIRARGWAVNEEERFVGAVGVAAPILGPGGRVLGALNVGTVTVRFKRRRTAIVAAVQSGAATISARCARAENTDRIETADPWAGVEGRA